MQKWRSPASISILQTKSEASAGIRKSAWKCAFSYAVKRQFMRVQRAALHGRRRDRRSHGQPGLQRGQPDRPHRDPRRKSDGYEGFHPDGLSPRTNHRNGFQTVVRCFRSACTVCTTRKRRATGWDPAGKMCSGEISGGYRICMDVAGPRFLKSWIHHTTSFSGVTSTS